jgi:hypothetical protein
VIRLAVRLLPRVHRDRHREEWTAELDEMERQNVSQLVSSLRILLGAPSMGWVLRVRDRRQRLVEDGRKRLTEVGKVFRKIVIALQVGGLTYLITGLTDQPQIWVLTVTVFIGGITLVVQFLNNIAYLLGNFEKKKKADATTQLGLNFTQFRPNSSPLAYGFAQLQINQLSQFLKGLSEDGQVSYDGEDRDWILGLTMQSRATIDATSSSTIDAGSKSYDGGLWTSDLGQRYLELQREAIRRGVAIRRIFILDNSRLTMESDFLRICRRQQDLGIHTRVLDQSTIPHDLKNLLFDFIVFDGDISYEVTPTSRVEDTMKLTTVKTHLVLQSDRVEERMRQFEIFWSAALEVY